MGKKKSQKQETENNDGERQWVKGTDKLSCQWPKFEMMIMVPPHPLRGENWVHSVWMNLTLQVSKLHLSKWSTYSFCHSYQAMLKKVVCPRRNKWYLSCGTGENERWISYVIGKDYISPSQFHHQVNNNLPSSDVQMVALNSIKGYCISKWASISTPCCNNSNFQIV